MPNIAVIVGSLRKDSINRKIARILVELAPPQLVLRIVEIGNLPLCNQDDDDQSPAESVAFRASVKAADAVCFVTPEYNRSIPAPLNNALDVGSRPYGQNVWAGKPGAIISPSPSPIGGFGANQHLRQSLVALDVPTLAQPEMYLGHADQLFDVSGDLTDDRARALMKNFLQAFQSWIRAVART
jgi:chromate reductase